MLRVTASAFFGRLHLMPALNGFFAQCLELSVGLRMPDTIVDVVKGVFRSDSGELVQVLADFPLVADAAIWAVYRSSRQLASKVRAFYDYFSAYYGSPPYWVQDGGAKIEG